MRSFLISRYIYFMCVSVFFLYTGNNVLAQGATKSGRVVRKILVIRKLTGLGSRAKINTPRYGTSASNDQKPPKEWVKIETTYDTDPEWIDNLEFRYYAISVRKEKGKNAYTFYKVTSKYADIEKGRDYLSAVYLRPAAIERYGELMGVAVEILHDGKVIETKAENHKSMSKTMQADWWKNPKITGSELVTIKTGYLFKKIETPFQYVDIDDHAYEK
ncbi:Amuc_1102 family pilus-like protein [Verrucomicrobiota bacterium]